MKLARGVQGSSPREGAAGHREASFGEEKRGRLLVHYERLTALDAAFVDIEDVNTHEFVEHLSAGFADLLDVTGEGRSAHA